MKTWAFVLFVSLSAGTFAARAQVATAPPDQRVRPGEQTSTSPDAAVKKRLANYSDAINGRNVAAVTEFFTDDAVLIDVDGNVSRGSSTINEQFARGFAAPSSYKLETAAESVPLPDAGCRSS